MNIKEELNKRVFGWMEDWFAENDLDSGDPKNIEFIMKNTEEFDKRKKENDAKYGLYEIPEEDNGVYGICKDDTVIRLTVYNKTYYVACAERLYCEAGVWKWRWF